MAWMVPHGNMQGEHMYMEEGFDASEENIKTKQRRRKKLLYKTVREQMEFYFSDANISKDRMLRQMVENDPYVPLEEFLKFNKITQLVSSVEEIAKAIKKSDFLELSEDSLKVHRKTPIKIKENEDECTIYVENLPPEITHDELKKVFSEFGKVVYVSIPKYHSTRAIKGFAFVEFDTVQEAAETIRIFEEKGRCLSIHMLPEKLCSIRTFDPNDTSKTPVGKCEVSNLDSCNDNEADTDVCDSEKLKDSSKTIVDENECEQPSLKKRKRECNDGDEGDEKGGSKKEKKIGNGKEEASSEQNGTDTKRETETSENESSTENKDDGTSEKKKKKNRKKKKRPKERELFANGMVVLSRKEWKRLRNKYLQMQRANMQRVKQQVWEARFMRRQPYTPHPAWDHGRNEEMRPPPPPIDAPKPRTTFIPGVIVCVKFNEPMVDVKGFKAEARTQPGVQYVDVSEGAFEAYLRCSGPSEAQHLLQINFWKNMSIVTGLRETEYWEKIARDREEKIGKKVKIPTEKGKKKLLRKAEIVKATHLHFDN
ncbi:la-related protein 7 [Thrips palmi]|uniref:La-related protein 7 n=1 Tax=Thrips palmi TaxID=161013 RepID=A0A6P8Z1R2_THRPL|nr:la-related protein 7 [Thrips palmi]